MFFHQNRKATAIAFSKAFASSMPYSLYSDLCHQRNWVPAGNTGSNLVLPTIYRESSVAHD
jgi:hypothetical protein